MKDWRPQLVEELRPAVIDFLHRVYFETKITLYLGMMDSPAYNCPIFGPMTAYTRRVASLDYQNICNFMAVEIGHDLMHYEKYHPDVTKYGFYLYQVPVPDTHTPLIRYAKQTSKG